MSGKEKKKILFFLPTLGSGGAERVLITVMNNLDRNEFSPEFLAFNESGDARVWIAPEIPFHSFGHKSVRQSVWPLIRLIRQVRPDILFTTMVHANALACLMKILFPRMKVIIRESSMPVALLKEYGAKGRICKYIYRFLYPRADMVISPAKLIVAQFEKDLGIRGIKHKVIYNPVDTARFYPLIPEIFEGGGNVVRFVCIGRLAREKGLDVLIKALGSARFDFDWRLDLIGDGDQSEKLQGLIAAYDLGEHITLRGFQAQPWVLAAQADCLLLPSLWEGMPNVVLEALACGVPAIAMRSAGAISEIGDLCSTDSLYIADTMDIFVQAMKNIKPQNKITRSPSILPNAFSLPHIVGEYAEVFRSISYLPSSGTRT